MGHAAKSDPVEAIRRRLSGLERNVQAVNKKLVTTQHRLDNAAKRRLGRQKAMSKLIRTIAEVRAIIDAINVEMKIKNIKKRKKTLRKLKKNVCKRWIKNVADICHERNYYLCTLSHYAGCQIPKFV